MKRKPLLIVLGLFFIALSANAQAYLVLRKKGTKRKYEYTVGDQLVYKQKGQEVFFADRITEFADSTIILENNLILLEQIEVVDVRHANTNRSEFLRVAEVYLPIIGGGLFLLDQINNTLVDGNDLSIHEGTAITSGAMIGTGLALKAARRKKVDLTNPKFEIYIVDLK